MHPVVRNYREGIPQQGVTRHIQAVEGGHWCIPEASLGSAAVSPGPLTSPPLPSPQCTDLFSQSEPAAWASAGRPLRWVSGMVGERARHGPPPHQL